MSKTDRKVAQQNKELRRKLEALKAETKYERLDVKITPTNVVEKINIQQSAVTKKLSDIDLIPFVKKDLTKTIILGGLTILFIVGLKVADSLGVNIPYLY